MGSLRLHENAPSAALSSFEGLARTDTALAVLATEAALRDPKLEKLMEKKDIGMTPAESVIVPDDSPINSAVVVSEKSENAEDSTGGLIGGSFRFKFCLKGDPRPPAKGYRFRKLGLNGGSKDHVKFPTTTIVTDSIQSFNGVAKYKGIAAEGVEEALGMDISPGEIKSEPNTEESTPISVVKEEQDDVTDYLHTSVNLDSKSEEPDSEFNPFLTQTTANDSENPENHEEQKEEQEEEEKPDTSEYFLLVLASSALNASQNVSKTGFNGSAVLENIYEVMEMDISPGEIKNEPSTEESTPISVLKEEQDDVTDYLHTSLNLDSKSEEPDSGFNPFFTPTTANDPENPENNEEQKEEEEEEKPDTSEYFLLVLASSALDTSENMSKTGFNGSVMLENIYEAPEWDISPGEIKNEPSTEESTTAFAVKEEQDDVTDHLHTLLNLDPKSKELDSGFNSSFTPNKANGPENPENHEDPKEEGEEEEEEEETKLDTIEDLLAALASAILEPSGGSGTSLDLDLKSEEPDCGLNSSFTLNQVNGPQNPDNEELQREEEEDVKPNASDYPLTAPASATLDASKDVNKTDFNGSTIPQQPVKVNQPENPENEEDQGEDEEEEREEKPDASEDPLAGRASAALDAFKDINKTDFNAAITQEPVEDTWYTVGFIKGTSYDVQSYFLLSDTDDLTVDNLPDLSNFPRIRLEPGTAYKFRVAGTNSIGRGEWSEVSPFKLWLPGVPGAPSAVKFGKANDGVHVWWEPPGSNPNRILEYSVYLAIGGIVKDTNGELLQRPFVRVYCGPNNHCFIGNTSLQAAHVDTSTKAAIIFRLAAKNDIGYGPQTQVRLLLQDTGLRNKATKRVSEASPAAFKKMKLLQEK